MPIDAIELLIADHERVRALLDALCRTSEADADTRNRLLAEIERELQIHTDIEEQIFYPLIRDAGGKEEVRMFYEAIEEHRAIDRLIMPDLKNTNAGGERFSGRAKVLKNLVEHHTTEEEAEMFASARRLLSEDELHELGSALERRKSELGP